MLHTFAYLLNLCLGFVNFVFYLVNRTFSFWSFLRCWHFLIFFAQPCYLNCVLWQWLLFVFNLCFKRSSRWHNVLISIGDIHFVYWLIMLRIIILITTVIELVRQIIHPDPEINEVHILDKVKQITWSHSISLQLVFILGDSELLAISLFNLNIWHISNELHLETNLRANTVDQTISPGSKECSIGLIHLFMSQ